MSKLTQQICSAGIVVPIQEAVLEVVSEEENLCYAIVNVRDGKLHIEVNHPFEIIVNPAYVD